MKPFYKYSILAAVLLISSLHACNKKDGPATLAPTPTPPIIPTDTPNVPVKLCSAPPASALANWGPNGFWLDGVLQFVPAATSIHYVDSGNYWLIEAHGATGEDIYISMAGQPLAGKLYYRAGGSPMKTHADNCAVGVGYRIQGQPLTWHGLYSLDNYYSDTVPVYVTQDSIYVSFQYHAGASSGGPPYDIKGRIKAAR